MPVDYILGAIGGLMIGLAAAAYLLGLGRIMGASGILGELVDGTRPADWRERLAFVLGAALVGGGLARALGAADSHQGAGPGLLILAGLAVGLGTRLANGCTSGHGVCGISRLAPRGMLASAVYILAGALTVLVLRHLLGVL